jgi:hypothetical protein
MASTRSLAVILCRLETSARCAAHRHCAHGGRRPFQSEQTGKRARAYPALKIIAKLATVTPGKPERVRSR